MWPFWKFDKMSSWRNEIAPIFNLLNIKNCLAKEKTQIEWCDGTCQTNTHNNDIWHNAVQNNDIKDTKQLSSVIELSVLFGCHLIMLWVSLLNVIILNVIMLNVNMMCHGATWIIFKRSGFYKTLTFVENSSLNLQLIPLQA